MISCFHPTSRPLPTTSPAFSSALVAFCNAEPPGSKLHDERCADVREAYRTLHFLNIKDPEAFHSLLDSNGQLSEPEAWTAAAMYLARSKHRNVALARQSFQRLCQFSESRGATTARCYPWPSQATIQIFLDNVNEAAIQKAVRRDSGSGYGTKGSAGHAVRTGLALAVRLLHIRIGADILGDDRVMLAASLPRTITPSEGAELPLAAICLFEEVAAGKDLFQQTYGRAPCLCLTGPALFSVRTLALIPHVNIRMIDALRSHISDIGSLDTNSAQVPYFELFAKVSKNKTPVHIRCPAEGFLQSTRLWAESHVRTLHALRQPFLFRQHMSPRGLTRNFLRATAWGPETVMKKDHLISSFYALLELPPLSL